MLNLRNDLLLTTPYECFKEINSVCHVDVIIGSEYNVLFDVNVLKKAEWNKVLEKCATAPT